MLILSLATLAQAAPATSQPANQERQPLAVSSYDQLPKHVGQLVTIQGRVLNSKSQSIMGVDISDEVDLRDRMATATGILRQYVIKPTQPADGLDAVQTRGPGVYYELLDPKTNKIVRAQPLSASPSTAPATQSAKVIEQAHDGTILLHARDVIIHGTTVRYEPNPHKNTVGYWTRKEDWVSWNLNVQRPGRFTVTILQGCGKGSGGSRVEFQIAGQKLTTTVQDTGGFQNFISREIGTINLPAGPQTLSVKPITKPGLAVMDLRSVTLTPVKE